MKSAQQILPFRTDIQALRGLAVLFVLLYHAEIGILQGGYLGVDIFFVISGYLITGIVKNSIEQGTFTFPGFYFRRAKRLLPAAYTTFLVTAVLAPIFLTKDALNDFSLQLFGAITYSANIFLWLQTGYFEGAAELKPLLHIWSLSIEEQYYLLLPAALVFTPRKYWAWGGWGVAIFSLAICLIFVSSKPDATFYWLPTRAWELALGSIGTLTLDQPKYRKILSRLNGPAIAGLFIVPIFPIGGSHPGTDAILVCSATLIVLLTRPTVLNTGRMAQFVAKVGDFSYSLYLIHWPIFAFAQNVYLSNIPMIVRIELLGLSLSLGYLLYRYIELPVRRMNIVFSKKMMISTVFVSAVIFVVPIALSVNQPSQQKLAEIVRVNFGFGKECEFKKDFAPKKKCLNSDKPKIMVWGDSFAMHLVPGIVASTRFGVVQATRSVCGPFLNIAPIGGRRNNRSWAENCLKFNQSVYQYLATKKSIQVVVLSSPFGQYLDDSSEDRKFHLLQDANGNLAEAAGGVLKAVKAMGETVTSLRAIGKKVVVVAPPPRGFFDIGKCLERKYGGKLVLGENLNCSIPIQEYRSKQKLVLEFLNKLPSQADVNVVRFDDLLCSNTTCKTIIDETFVYRDKQHLSYSGSTFVGVKMGLTDLLLGAAY